MVGSFAKFIFSSGGGGGGDDDDDDNPSGRAAPPGPVAHLTRGPAEDEAAPHAAAAAPQGEAPAAPSRVLG